MKLILAVGDDYWGRRAEIVAARYEDVIVAIDRSGGTARAIKLILRGSIPFRAAGHMWLSRRTWPRDRPVGDRYYGSNAELRDLAEREGVRNIVLFRAGLIISGKTIDKCDVRNIHCARVDGYGGLAAIYRAVRDGATEQWATLHRVTTRIDEGEVLDTEPFTLNPRAGYSSNEALAYEAGLRLIARTLENFRRENSDDRE